MKQKHVVRLIETERQALEALIHKGKAAHRAGVQKVPRDSGLRQYLDPMNSRGNVAGSWANTT